MKSNRLVRRMPHRGWRRALALVVGGVLLSTLTPAAKAEAQTAATCTFDVTGSNDDPHAYQLVTPSTAPLHFRGEITCTGTWLGQELDATHPGKLTMTQTGSGPAGAAYGGSSCAFGNEVFEVKAALWLVAGSKIDARGSFTFVRGVYWEALEGALDGVPVAGYGGYGADPDEHDGTCVNPDDPFHNLAVTGRLVAGGRSASTSVPQQMVITWPEYQPSGYVGLPVQYEDVGPVQPPNTGTVHVYDYPVFQGDTITWTNTDVLPHTVTSCGSDCDAHTYPDYPAPTGTFDGDLRQAGVSFTVDTANLAPGTYHYFCEFHRYMRGSFTVLPRPTVQR